MTGCSISSKLVATQPLIWTSLATENSKTTNRILDDLLKWEVFVKWISINMKRVLNLLSVAPLDLCLSSWGAKNNSDVRLNEQSVKKSPNTQIEYSPLCPSILSSSWYALQISTKNLRKNTRNKPFRMVIGGISHFAWWLGDAKNLPRDRNWWLTF